MLFFAEIISCKLSITLYEKVEIYRIWMAFVHYANFASFSVARGTKVYLRHVNLHNTLTEFFSRPKSTEI